MTLDARPLATERVGIKVAVFDRRPLVADGFAALLGQSSSVEIVGVGTSPRAVARLLESTPVDVVVVGIASPDVKVTVRLLGWIPADRWVDGPRLVGIVSGEQDVADVIGGPKVTVITTRTDPDTLHEVVISATPGGVGTIRRWSCGPLRIPSDRWAPSIPTSLPGSRRCCAGSRTACPPTRSP